MDNLIPVLFSVVSDLQETFYEHMAESKGAIADSPDFRVEFTPHYAAILWGGFVLWDTEDNNERDDGDILSDKDSILVWVENGLKEIRDTLSTAPYRF